MSKYNKDTIVVFYASTGYVGASREEETPLVDLGWDEDLTDEETEAIIEEAYDDWLANYTNLSWYTK
ncbi:hypothetical protein MG295_00028 [Bacillus phage vB_BcgM]|nr:hypothetical protein MG295_00028 [Bacillus phage vB_BcgM]